MTGPPFFTILSCGSLLPGRERAWQDALSPAVRRQDPRIRQMTCLAASRALDGKGISPASVITATSLGALDETRVFLEGIFTTGLPSPRAFISSVHNSMAGRLAVDLKIRGPNLTFCDGPNSLAAAIAACAMLDIEDFPALLVAVEENTDLIRELAADLNTSCAPFLRRDWEEGAIALVLDQEQKTSLPRIRALGPRPLRDSSTQDALNRITRELGTRSCQYLPDLSSSAISPALALMDLIGKAEAGSRLLGTFSPSAQSAAVIELCI